jgi:hypothetical protein
MKASIVCEEKVYFVKQGFEEGHVRTSATISCGRQTSELDG